MTNKRFKTNEVGCIVDLRDKHLKNYDGEEIVDLLNELSEEKNYFEKKKCEYFNKWNLSHLDNINLKKENERLKKEIEHLRTGRSNWKITASEEIIEKESLMKQIVELKQKNRQLNSENKMLKYTIARNESYIERLTHKEEWSN